MEEETIINIIHHITMQILNVYVRIGIHSGSVSVSRSYVNRAELLRRLRL